MKKEIVRKELKELELDTKYKFEAEFKRFGLDKRTKEKGTVLLLNVYLIKDNSEKKFVTDHVWVKDSKRWNNARDHLKEGIKVRFTAEVKPYYKEGNREFFENYALSNIRSVEII